MSEKKELMKIDVRDSKYGKFDDIAKKVEQMKERAFEFSQTRSSFQIEKFVGADQYTPSAKYRHFAHNSYVMLGNVKDMLIDRERTLRKKKRLQYQLEHQHDDLEEFKKNGGQFIKNEEGIDVPVFDPNYNDLDLDLYQLDCALDEIEISIKGSIEEINILENICDELERQHGRKFTSKDFEDEQPLEWYRRFANQMHRHQAAGTLGVGEGNYSSYLQAIEEPILPDSKSSIEQIPTDFNNLAVTALKDRGGINNKLLQPIENAPKELDK